MQIYINKETLTHSIHKENVLDGQYPRAKVITMEVSEEVFKLMKMVPLPRYFEMAEELIESNKISARIKARINELLNIVKENLAFNS